MKSLIRLLAASAAFGTSAVVQAQDQAQEWPRFHIGFGMGFSHSGQDWDSAGVPPQIEPNESLESPMGWRLVAGFRPVRVVGAEIEYVDFGTAEAESNYSANASLARGYSMKSEANATVLAATLFLPLQSPTLDVYGKVGVAQLEESIDVNVYEFTQCTRTIFPLSDDPACSFRSQVDQTDSRAYAGIGARIKLKPTWGVRVEYEAIDGDVSDATTMLSVSIAWEH